MDLPQHVHDGIIKLAKKYGVEMPIVAQVNRILFEDEPARSAVMELMQRDLKQETE